MPDKSITDKSYEEWPELNYTKQRQYWRNISQYLKCGRILYGPTKEMYTLIRDRCIDTIRNHIQAPPKFCWKPKIIDIGCGGGWGSYILSHEADFVWGIDVDECSIQWAKEIYEKHKNGIYYSSQLTFDVIDIRNDPREFMKFDVIACIEVIEHIDEYEKTLKFIKDRFKIAKDGEYKPYPEGSIAYISSPNRRHPKMGKATPKNKRHVREWTPDEMYGVLTKHFKQVYLLNTKGEKQELNTEEAVLLFQCELPIV